MGTLNSSIFHWIFFILAGNKHSNKRLDGFEIRQDWTNVRKKSPNTYNGRNVASALVLSFLNDSSSFLQVTRINHKSLNELEFLPDPITNY